MKPTCKNCLWAEPISPLSDLRKKLPARYTHVCRGEVSTANGWPCVGQDDWCRLFQPCDGSDPNQIEWTGRAAVSDVVVSAPPKLIIHVQRRLPRRPLIK